MIGFEAASESSRSAGFSLLRSDFESLGTNAPNRRANCLDAARFVLGQVEPNERILALMLNQSGPVQFRAAQLKLPSRRLNYSVIPKRPDRDPIDLTTNLSDAIAAREKPVIYMSGSCDRPPYHDELEPAQDLSSGGITLLFPVDDPEQLVRDAQPYIPKRTSVS